MSRYGRDDDGDLPPRIAARPDPQQWDLDELMTLAEAAALHWPHGPLTARSLRTAIDDGMLPVVMVARKLLTSRRALQEMGRCQTRTKPEPAPNSPKHKRPPSADRDADAAYRRLMQTLEGKSG